MLETTTPARIGPHDVVRRLAVGGMAEVFLAHSPAFSGRRRLVALKRLRPEYGGERSFAAMFRDEVWILGALCHPNVVRIHGAGHDGGVPYYTMEYVDGITLEHLAMLARRDRALLPLGFVVAVLAEVAAALHHAHERRAGDGAPLAIVHRDVSPSNILLGSDGRVKLVDFGVARAARRETQTRRHEIKGRVGYMSPEQCLGERVDRRSDVYVLGTLLYELTTGVHPFTGDGFDVMCRTALADVPAPSRAVDAYPPLLEAIVMNALQRDRDERYATAEQMRFDLKHFAEAFGLHCGQRARSAVIGELARGRPRTVSSRRAVTAPAIPALHTSSHNPV